MSYEFKRDWDGNPQSIEKPLTNLVKDFHRHELPKPRTVAPAYPTFVHMENMEEHGWRQVFKYYRDGDDEYGPVVKIFDHYLVNKAGKTCQIPDGFYTQQEIWDYEEVISLGLKEREAR